MQHYGNKSVGFVCGEKWWKTIGILGCPIYFHHFSNITYMQVIYNLWDWMLWMCPVEGVQQDVSLASALLHTTNFLNKVFKVAPCELQGKHLGKSLIFLIRENGMRKHQLFLSSGQALRSAMEKRLRAHASHVLVGHPAIPKLSKSGIL